MCLNIEQKHREGFEAVCAFALFLLYHFIGGTARKAIPSGMCFSTSTEAEHEVPP